MSPVILSLNCEFLKLLGTSRWERWVHSIRLCSTHSIFHNNIKYTFPFKFADVHLLVDSNGVILGIAGELLWISLLHSRRRDPFQCSNIVGALRLLTQLMIYCTVSVSALSQGIAGPTLRSGVNYLYFSSVLISIRLLWKPYLTSFSDLCYCS